MKEKIRVETIKVMKLSFNFAAGFIALLSVAIGWASQGAACGITLGAIWFLGIWFINWMAKKWYKHARKNQQKAGI